MFAVALVAPNWPIFKKHITSWHDLVVFSIGMEFVAYLGITTMASVGQTWCLPWERTAQLARLVKPLWYFPLHIKERDATTSPVSPSQQAWSQSHTEQACYQKHCQPPRHIAGKRCRQQSPGNLGSRIKILWSPFSPDKRTILRKPARRTANNKNIP